MNTATSIFLAGVIAAFVAIDAVFFGLGGSLFLARKFVDLLEWAAFWR